MGGRKYAFNDYFEGFGRVTAVGRIFCEKTEEVLSNLKVEFTWFRGYMWTSKSTDTSPSARTT
jgi:hypothetical protein